MTRTHLDDFENALLTDLRQEIDGRGSIPTPNRKRRGLSIAGTLGLAAMAVVVGSTVLQPDDAFAVKPQTNGDVVVTIDEFSDAEGLERALSAKGIEADVDYSAEEGGMVAKAPESGPGGEIAKAEAQDPMEGPCSVDVTIAADGSTTFRLQSEVVDSPAELTVRLIGDADAAVVGVAWTGGQC